MTKLLDQAIEKIRALSDEDQDSLALRLLTDIDGIIEPLDEQTRAALREGLEQARRGEFVPDDEMEALWRRFGA